MDRGETIGIIIYIKIITSIGLLYLSVQFLTKLNKFQCKMLTLFTSHTNGISVESPKRVAADYRSRSMILVSFFQPYLFGYSH